jgi:hypothetical protein
VNLKRYFDRVVLVNLKRRPDRLASVQASLHQCQWPFKWPTTFHAVDGNLIPRPEGWQSGAGAWGCMRSHQQIFEKAMIDGVKSLLILEDDVCFVSDFTKKVEEFLRVVPDDWDQIMLGGEHVNTNGVPTLIKPGVYRCTDCERTHCYAIRGEFLKKLYRRWVSGGDFNGEVHCDWIMGRDPEMQSKHHVYAPEKFLVGQERGRSDIDGNIQARKFWNPPASDLPVLNLRVPQSVLADLKHYGIHTGQHEDSATGIDSKLLKIFAETEDDPDNRVERLSQRISELQWEVASDPFLICTIWHPDATLEQVEQASRGPVYEVLADSTEAALMQLPDSLRQPARPLLANMCVIHLNAPRRVMDGLRTCGWHNGFQSDRQSGYDKSLIQIADNRLDPKTEQKALADIVSNLQREASGIHQGVAVIWHPGISGQMVQTATRARVVEISAKDVRDALDQFEDTKATLFNHYKFQERRD